VKLGHFTSLLLTALLISVIFAWLTRTTTKERIACALRFFLYFVVISVALGWLMFPFTR
jgi:hypothetical protein